MSKSRRSASRWRYLLPAGVALGLFVLLGVGLTLKPADLPSPLVGKPAPTFSLPDLLAPDRLVTEAVWNGQVTLVNVWASWCVSCREEHEVLKQAAAGGARILGLNYKDERADALRWLETLGNPYLAVPFDADGRVGIDWGVYKVPESFVLDRQGRVRYKQLGAVTQRDWQEKIAPLMRALESES